MRKPLYPVERDAEPATVCVTGGTGYIAGVIIARLLAAGHTVHATVRDPNNKPKLRWLKALPHASSHLRFFKVSTCAELASSCRLRVTSHLAKFVIYPVGITNLPRLRWISNV